MNRNLLSTLITVGLLTLALITLVVVDAYDNTPAVQPTHAPCRPLPDPDDCVQLGWLDGAWRCIPTEQAG